MKVMVCLKQVPHQDARLDVNADGTWIQEDNIKFEINCYDTYAVEEALRIKDAGDAEVIVVSIGPDRVTQALRTALGMGADRAIHVNDDGATGADALGAAKILAAIAKEEGADLIITRPDVGRRQRLGGPADGGRAARHAVRHGRRRDGHVGRRLDQGRARARGWRLRSGRAAAALPASRSSRARTRSDTPRSRASCRPRRSRSTSRRSPTSASPIPSARRRTRPRSTRSTCPPKGDTAEILQGSTDEIVSQLVTKIKELGLL